MLNTIRSTNKFFQLIQTQKPKLIRQLMDKPSNNNKEDNKTNNEPRLLTVALSVLSAFFGVQSSKNKERDFKHGNHRTFILVGIGFALVFILSVYSVVQLVLYAAQPN